jgi:hypothetical protein
VKTVDGLPQLVAVNTLAQYIVTALITMPKRLVYLSSGLHYGTGSHLDDMLWMKRRWNGSQAYAETKFQDERRASKVPISPMRCTEYAGRGFVSHLGLRKPLSVSIVAGSGSRGFWWKKYLTETVAAGSSLVANQTWVR